MNIDSYLALDDLPIKWRSTQVAEEAPLLRV
jgi:hypothetical protein